MQLKETKIIKGTIVAETGLFIGGAKNTLDIGGLDSPVIKTPNGVPYIPGSSIKGKLRSLLALTEGVVDYDSESILMRKMFGVSGSDKGNKKEIQEENGMYRARLLIRDAYLDEEAFDEDFDGAILETRYTESKYENTIDRATGKTKQGGLRQLERVPAGAKFKFEIVVNIYSIDNAKEIEDKLHKGIDLLENNYLGGSGTRGYGKIKFVIDPDIQSIKI